MLLEHRNGHFCRALVSPSSHQTENKIHENKMVNILRKPVIFFSLCECIRGQRNYTSILREAEHLKPDRRRSEIERSMAPIPQYFFFIYPLCSNIIHCELEPVNMNNKIYDSREKYYSYLKFITHFKFK